MPKWHVWALVGDDTALVDIATTRLVAELDLPMRKITGKTNGISILHVMNELDMLADRWVLVLDNPKRIDGLAHFVQDLPKALGKSNYLIMTGDVPEDIMEFVSTAGKAVNCEKPDGKKDLYEVLDRIFVDQRIRLTMDAANAIISVTGFSVGAIKNAAGVLRLYYAKGDENLDLGYNEVTAIVPTMNYEDVFTVVNEILRRNQPTALDYYSRLAERGDIQWLFMDRLITAFRDIYLFTKFGDLTAEQQDDLGLDIRSYSRIKNMGYPLSEKEALRIFRVVLDVYHHAKGSADRDFMVQTMIAYIIKVLRGEEAGLFPARRKEQARWLTI